MSVPDKDVKLADDLMAAATKEQDAKWNDWLIEGLQFISTFFTLKKFNCLKIVQN